MANEIIVKTAGEKSAKALVMLLSIGESQQEIDKLEDAMDSFSKALVLVRQLKGNENDVLKCV